MCPAPTEHLHHVKRLAALGRHDTTKKDAGWGGGGGVAYAAVKREIIHPRKALFINIKQGMG